MANDKDITIGLKTTGADAAAGSIRKVEKATSDLSNTGGRDLARSMETMTDKARVAEFAYYDLGAEMKKVNMTGASFTSGQAKIQSSSKNSAQALLMLSQGFEDAQYGIRGVLNNIPGLVIALGGTAGLAGAISIAAVSLSQILPLFAKTEETTAKTAQNAQDTADRIKQISTNMGEMEGERFDKVIQEFEDVRAAALALKDQTDLTKAAENAYSLAAIDNAAKHEQAIRNLITALGFQLDKAKELLAIASAEQQQRELTTAQAIEAENAKVEKAREAQTTASDTLGEQEASLNVDKARLVEMRAQLQTLRDQKTALEESVRIGKQALANIAGSGEMGGSAADISAVEQMRKASGKLEDPAFKQNLDGSSEKVDVLAAKIEKQERSISVLLNVLNAAVQAREDVEGAATLKVQELQQSLEQSNFVAQSETLLKTQEATAAKLTEIYSQIETQNVNGNEAKQAILKAASDGKVTAAEQKEIADDVVRVIGQVQSGQATTKGNVQELINLQKSMAEQAARDNALLQAHSKQIEDLYARMRR